MAETNSSVTCPECETAFDPTAEGGWCTECGKYQADDAGASSPAEEARAAAAPAAPVERSDPADDVGATSAEDATTAPETDPTCPDCGAAVETDWSACPFCATGLSASTSDADGETASVVLEIGERELTAPVDEPIGREVRTAHVETGGTEREAQYVHREHVRFERDGEEVVLVNEGRNGARLNDESLGVGDRAIVSDGDRLVFSGRVAATVRFR